jgi:hypothetical protein
VLPHIFESDTLSNGGEGMPDAARVRAVPEQVSSETGGEFVILDLKSGRYHGMADVAARIWELVQDGATVGQIDRAIRDEYDVDPTACRRDVESFLADLRSRGLVEIDEVGAR